MQFRITPKIKMYIVTGAVVLALTGSYFFLFRAQIAKISTLNGQLQQLETSFAKVKKDEAYLPKLEVEIAESKLKIMTIHQRLPAEYDIAKIVDELSLLANKTGIKDYEALTPVGMTILKDYTVVPLKVGFSCKFSKFIEYLVGLDELSFLTRVDGISVRATDTKSEEVGVNLDFTVFNTPESKLK